MQKYMWIIRILAFCMNKSGHQMRIWPQRNEIKRTSGYANISATNKLDKILGVIEKVKHWNIDWLKVCQLKNVSLWNVLMVI